MAHLEIEKGSSHDTACECCGGRSRIIAASLSRWQRYSVSARWTPSSELIDRVAPWRHWQIEPEGTGTPV